MELKKPFFVGLGVFFGLFAVSLVFFLVLRIGRVQRVLFFPKEGSTELYGELHNLPRRRSRESNIELLVSELLLGPVTLHLDRVFPRGTALNSLILREGSLYVDFSSEIFLGQKSSRLSLEEMISTAKKTILFNFKRIKTIIITIEGQVPGAREETAVSAGT